jgi:hypothetical protein
MIKTSEYLKKSKTYNNYEDTKNLPIHKHSERVISLIKDFTKNSAYGFRDIQELNTEFRYIQDAIKKLQEVAVFLTKSKNK